jgi:methanogenic corrinoid protein MtbC1
MHPLYAEFISYLNAEDKAKCVRFILSGLQNQAFNIVTLYNEILTPALYEDFRKEEEKEICIWKEHIRTSIVRTIIECCYPFIVKERDEKYGNSSRGEVIVLCPPEELHEIGARMVADFFTLCGLNVTFAGANTPQDDIINAIKYHNPNYVAISITNYYNLVAARRVIMKIREVKREAPFQIIFGGQACRGNLDTCRNMGADMILNTFEDIKKLVKG